MSTRFAGDFFGVPLVFNDETELNLLEYFPSLGRIEKGQTGSEGSARSVGGTKAAKLFTGFKTFEKPVAQAKATPAFAGFKTLETGRPQAQ